MSFQKLIRRKSDSVMPEACKESSLSDKASNNGTSSKNGASRNGARPDYFRERSITLSCMYYSLHVDLSKYVCIHSYTYIENFP